MNKPYIKTLMLGTSIKELADFVLHQDEYEIHGNYGDYFDNQQQIYRSYSPNDWWEYLIKLLVISKDKNIRFIEDTDSEYPDSGEIFAPKLDLPVISYDGDSYYHLEDDVVILNNFVKDFYGTKSKTVKAKITNREYANKKKCPVCKKQKGIRQQGHIWVDGDQAHRNLGCDLCNATWQENFVISSFSNLGVR